MVITNFMPNNIDKAIIEFRKLWSNITKENQHLTTEKIEDLIKHSLESQLVEIRSMVEGKRMSTEYPRPFIGDGIPDPTPEIVNKFIDEILSALTSLSK